MAMPITLVTARGAFEFLSAIELHCFACRQIVCLVGGCVIDDRLLAIVPARWAADDRQRINGQEPDRYVLLAVR
jgi:hypothetical protein